MTDKNNNKLSALVGMNIAMRRRAKNWTQAELAERLDMGTDSLSRIERGVVAPRFPCLEEFAEALESTVADLFKTSEELVREKLSDYSQIPITDVATEINLLAERITILSKKINMC